MKFLLIIPIALCLSFKTFSDDIFYINKITDGKLDVVLKEGDFKCKIFSNFITYANSDDIGDDKTKFFIEKHDLKEISLTIFKKDSEYFLKAIYNNIQKILSYHEHIVTYMDTHKILAIHALNSSSIIELDSYDFFYLYDSDFGSSRTIRALCK